MQYLIVLGICVLSTMKMSFQSLFAKKGVKTTADSVFFISMIFAASSLVFLPYVIYINLEILAYAALFALCSVVFQLVYTRALSEGNVSFAVMFANFAMIGPIIVSCVVYGEKPSVLRIIGIALTACAFLVTVKPEGKTTKRSLLFCFLAMLANSSVGITQKIFSSSEYSDKNFTFSSVAYLISAVLAIGVYFVLAARGNRKTFKIGKLPIIAAIGAGVSLGVYLALNTYATATIDGTFLFPAHAGGSIIFSTFTGLIFFRDKLTVRQIIALILGTSAIVLMNF